MATRDGATIQVLVWNYHDDLVAVAATPVHLAIALPAGFGPAARVSHLRVDESHGDAYTVWVAQGMPASPSAAQVAALKLAMAPSSVVPDATVAVAADGSVGVDFDLPRFGISLLSVVPAVDDGGATPSPGKAGGGCACQVGRSEAEVNPAALFAMIALVLATLARLRRGPRIY
jgi:MYXO-CTERM domain-containing protein